MRHFAFFPSHLEPGQYLLSQRLEQAGFKIFWIMQTTSDKEWLVRLGAHPDDILVTFPAKELQYSDLETDERLKRLENDETPFINDIIAMDRRLRYKNDYDARRYLAHGEKVITDFLLSRGVQFVSNGRDTALHLACHKICQRLGISAVVPTVIRVPDGRWGFCNGHTISKFIELGAVTSQHLREAEQLVDDFTNKPIVPLSSIYERKNKQSFLKRLPKDFVRWFSLTRRGLSDIGNDIGRYSSVQLLRMAINRRWNAVQTRRAGLFDPVGTRPYIFYPAHMQPESSIDVLGSHVSNQFNLVSVIAKSTPCTHDIYVKPHPDDLGGRSRAELLAFKKIPGVRLISPYVKSSDLIRGASLTLTLTGTVAMESSFFCVPSITFVETFFSTMPHVCYCRSLSDLPDLIPHLLNLPPRENKEENIRFVAHLLANSFEVRFTNYLGPYTEKELETLVHAYSVIYDRLRGGENHEMQQSGLKKDYRSPRYGKG